MGRDIRLYYERVAALALVFAATVPLYFLLTGFAVAGPKDAALVCGTTVSELGRDRSTDTDPNGACHAGAVQRLHVAGAYLGAFAAVALSVLVVGAIRERGLNGAWERGQAASRWLSTPGQVWILAGLLFVVFIAFAQAGL